MGVISFYRACSEVMATEYDLVGSDLQAALDPILKPFYGLSSTDKSRFYMVKNAGELGGGYCYYPTKHIGKNMPNVREALIKAIGGWKESDFN